MSHQHVVYAKCNRCGSTSAEARDTEAAVTRRQLGMSWRQIDLPFGLRLLLCADCARFASVAEILQEISRSALAQLPPEPPTPPPEVLLG